MKVVPSVAGTWAVLVLQMPACARPAVDGTAAVDVLTTTPAMTMCSTLAECEFACHQQQLHSCERLAHMYETGQGAPQNLPRAATLYARACDGGAVDACAHLAMMYDIGIGVARDTGKAAFLYERACAQGDRWSCTRSSELGPNSPATGRPPQYLQ